MEKHLRYLAAFQSVLANYKISAAARQILADTKIALFVGPTSSGRNTIIAELLKTDKYHPIISDTTRQPRVKDGQAIEKNGREYWFRDEADILRDLQDGAFVEAALIHNQQVSGISIREVEKAHHANLIGITDIEPGGAQTIHRLKPDVLVIFVVPPSFQEWMHRLDSRGIMPNDEKIRRLESAVKEFEASLGHDYYTFLINETLDKAVERSFAITQTGVRRPEKQAHARAVTQQLLDDTRAFLGENR